MVPTQLLNSRIGDQEVLIEAYVPPGTEQLSARRVQEGVSDLFERARGVVEAAAEQAAETVRRIGEQAEPPDEVTIELGLSFSTTGTIILSSSTAGACLAVSLTYKIHPATAPSDGERAGSAQVQL